jgi:hypothetical protein
VWVCVGVVCVYAPQCVLVALCVYLHAYVRARGRGYGSVVCLCVSCVWGVCV